MTRQHELTSKGGIIAFLCLLCCGCATEPKYEYTKQKDSANIRCGDKDPGPGSFPSLLGDSQIAIDGIDGSRIGFFESHGQAYCAPGKHIIALSFRHIARGLYSGEGSGSTSGAVYVLLEGSHTYRFTALFGFHTFSVTLWDETGGMANRSILSEWSIEKQHVEIITPTR